MSTLKVSEIRNASSATGGLSIAADGVVSGALPYPNRNLLYNGAMQVAQRGTSTASITTAGYYTADRWQHSISGLGTWTQTVENDAPTGTGFRKSLKILCTTADAAPAASDYVTITQPLEGQDVQRIAKGTASAQQLSLSFWVKSNVTGTYVVELNDSDNTRIVSSTYSIAASSTWEKKSITFPADTSGVLDNDNAASLRVFFWLGAGTDFTSGSLGTTWAAASNANRAVGQTNLAAATNNYWQVTGVQLEVGDTATPFEFKSFGQELAECQRYYFRVSATAGNQQFGAGTAYSTTQAYTQVQFPVPMRAIPSAVEQSGAAADYRQFTNNFGAQNCTGVPTYSNNTTTLLGVVTTTVASGLVAGDFSPLASTNSSAYLGWSAEL